MTDTAPPAARIGFGALGLTKIVVVDTVITVLIMIAVCLEYAFPFDDGNHAGDQSLSFLLSLLFVAPLAVRRVWPMRSFLIMSALLAGPNLLVPHTFLFFGGQVPMLFGLATVFRYHRLRTAGWAVPAMIIGLASVFVRVPATAHSSDALFLAVFIGLAAAVGTVLRIAATRRQQLADALHRLRQANAVHDRTAVLAERSRVARDLHDVVAHAVSLMVVQAGAARLALQDQDAAVADEFLAGVQRAGAGAERELAVMLGALRSDRRADVAVPAAVGLAALPTLIDSMRTAGLEINLRTLGEPPTLSPGLDLAAYRIVQEGLTNVLRHAGPTEVELTVSFADPLQLTMIDSGPRGARPVPARSGQGLIGMAERAALFGGRMQAEPLARGWLLRVWLPVAGAIG